MPIKYYGNARGNSSIRTIITYTGNDGEKFGPSFIVQNQRSEFTKARPLSKLGGFLNNFRDELDEEMVENIRRDHQLKERAEDALPVLEEKEEQEKPSNAMKPIAKINVSKQDKSLSVQK
ncbi:MAG: hypothetical protein K0R25_362 [Rickettsiaceae bacterium]|jgi:hypothetical protein|nr:hypothetical protein [Rickettsiaceae bacterium]